MQSIQQLVNIALLVICLLDQSLARCPSHIVSRLRNGVKALTDTQTPDGDYVIIQRRESAGVNFNRNWAAYESFFGDLCTNYWLGLDNIHQLCNPGASCELRIDMRHKGADYYAHYSSFSVASASDKYRLQVDGYSGNAGDALRHQNGMKFTTSDSDNDWTGYNNCAHAHQAGWWFSDCGWSNLNGPWIEPGSDGTKKWAAINWSPLTHWEDSLSFVEMKIKSTPRFFDKSTCWPLDTKSYNGTLDRTISGYTCQRWDSQYPHKHSFRARDLVDQRTDHNYCRYTSKYHTNWCHTTNPNVPTEVCQIPICVCEDGWMYNAKQNACYRLFNLLTSYGGAVKNCKGVGATLAESRSESENTFLNYLGGGGQKIWLRGQWIWEGEWVRNDGNLLSNVYTNWYQGSPNNAGGNEHCLVMYGDSKWDDVPCDSKFLKHVCVKPPIAGYIKPYKDGWKGVRDTCVQVNRRLKTWEQADAICQEQEQDAHLLFVDSSDMESALKAQAGALHIQNNVNYYIGLKATEHGDLFWKDGNKKIPATYTPAYWPGATAHTDDKRCTLLRKGLDIKIASKRCVISVNRYICQFSSGQKYVGKWKLDVSKNKGYEKVYGEGLSFVPKLLHNEMIRRFSLDFKAICGGYRIIEDFQLGGIHDKYDVYQGHTFIHESYSVFGNIETQYTWTDTHFMEWYTMVYNGKKLRVTTYRYIDAENNNAMVAFSDWYLEGKNIGRIYQTLNKI